MLPPRRNQFFEHKDSLLSFWTDSNGKPIPPRLPPGLTGVERFHLKHRQLLNYVDVLGDQYARDYVPGAWGGVRVPNRPWSKFSGRNVVRLGVRRTATTSKL
ncbi:hypothetical protein G9P44_006171 [Scheffersomyces stipitis]|nr:hypothetical protein G9P44_006171 [Scheffersomyces stipitis]